MNDDDDDDPRPDANTYDRDCALLEDKWDAERDDRMQGVGMWGDE